MEELTRPLGLLLAIKIAVTAIVVLIPDLFFPVEKLTGSTSGGAGLLILFRLYGIAMLALLVGYASGLVDVFGGIFPRGIVLMGVVSNGGSVLATLAFAGAQGINGGSLFFGTVALLLLAALVWPGLATRSFGRSRSTKAGQSAPGKRRS